MAGVANLLLQTLNWKLTAVDTAKEIEGQFLPTDLVQNVAASYAQFKTLGRAQPILQFQNDELETITFTARVWAKNIFHTVEDLINEIKELPRIDKDFGRPLIYEFTAGESLSMTCVVKSIGGIRYDRMRPTTGTLRGVTFSIELWRFDEYDVALTGSVAESLVLAFKDNESFESVAVRVYGDANAGEPLRRRNPDKVIPEAGDLIHFPPKSKLTTGFSLAPECVPLEPEDRQLTARRAHLLLRTRTYRSHILGPAWEGN